MTPTSSSLFALAYQNLLKPLLFKFDAEKVHNSFTALGKIAGSNVATQLLTQLIFSYQHASLGKTVDGIFFPNPVGLSAGFDYNGELTDILPMVGFGWHTIGTVTLHPYEGNTPPRLGRFPKSQALLVNKGFKSRGAEVIISQLAKKNFRIPTGISIGSTNKHFNSVKEQLSDIAHCFQLFEQSNLKHSYYELNISCPNTFGGQPFTEPSALHTLLTMTNKLALTRPVYIKMPIDQSEAATLGMLEVANRHNIQGLIFGNLTKDHNNPAVHPDDVKQWESRKGNLSGKPTWNRSNNLLRLSKVQYKNRFTLVGTGGVFSGQDAATKLELGADLVQLISGMIFQGPQLIGQINHYLATKSK